MSAPTVSYVIAAWNAAPFIARAIHSALDQADDFEVIVVDDASTDDTAAVVAAIENPRLRYHRLERNSGPAAARNKGFDLARGRWVGVLDADDYLLPGRTAMLLDRAEAGELDICADNVWIELQDAPEVRRLQVQETLDGEAEVVTFDDYCARNQMLGGGANYGYLKPLFRADYLRAHNLRYSEALKVGEDFLLVAEALIQGARFERIRAAGYVYLTRSGSISHRLQPEHADAMVAADERFLIQYAPLMTSNAHKAMLRHLKGLRAGAAFMHMVEAVKRRDATRFVRHVRTQPGALRHFWLPISAKIGRTTQKIRDLVRS